MLAYRHIKVEACFKTLIEGVLMAPLDSRYTQVGFNLISVQVCNSIVILEQVSLVDTVHIFCTIVCCQFKYVPNEQLNIFPHIRKQLENYMWNFIFTASN